MIPTFFSAIASGTITAMVASIMALSSWVSGSAILQGNLFFDTTNNGTPKVFVGIQESMNITASGLNFVTNGSQSGVVLKDNGTVSHASRIVTCTATGGNVKVNNGAKYDTCIMANPLSTTGAIKRIDLMVAASPVDADGFDCGFVKGLVSGTGTAFVNLGNKNFLTGSLITFSTGSLQWNSADYIKCGTLTNPTSSFSAKLRVEYFDDTSE